MAERYELNLKNPNNNGLAQYQQLDSSNKVNIKCNNKSIERVKEYKLLGIILDENFELHSTLIKF